jgi:para-aminobenzoate N-oxygenase AurF
VLAGEVPIDQLQRGELRSPRRHPLLRRIMQIHVTEEARHVCFAEQYLAANVPQLSRQRLAQLRVMLPFITAETAKLMLRPPSWVLRRHGVPAVIAADAKFASRARAFSADCVRPLLETYQKLGLITPLTLPLWHAVGFPPSAPVLGQGETRLLGR